MQPDSQRLVHEVQRVHTRYHCEVVEAFALCPWAKEARSGGRVHMNVTFMTRADPHAALAAIDQSMSDPAIEIGMLIFPRLALDRLAFAHFVADVRALDEARSGRGEQRVALADFHPNAPADVTTPERLVPFLRRAPDPMIQSVRTGTLERVRGEETHGTRFVDLAAIDLMSLATADQTTPSSLAARVAQHNARSVERIGIAKLKAVIDDILADRNSSYRALGIDPVQPELQITSSGPEVGVDGERTRR
jgi:hypothetical protein